MKSIFLTLSTGLMLLVFTACSTPASRIAKNPELFASFPEAVQAKIREGQVDIGFTREMVEIALDKPDRRYTRQSEAGRVEVWSYVDTQLNYDKQRVRGTFQVKDGDGRIRTVHDDVWVTVRNETEFEVMRIEFNSEGEVSAIENME